MVDRSLFLPPRSEPGVVEHWPEVVEAAEVAGPLGVAGAWASMDSAEVGDLKL